MFDNQAGHVGGPTVGIEYKLEDVEEMGYDKNSVPYPKGEICIRGPSIFTGYFKNKLLTEQVKD
jgi:long-chain acyl-CoA synthetase